MLNEIALHDSTDRKAPFVSRRIRTCVALCAIGALTVWIRLKPLDLLSANDRALDSIREEFEAQILKRIPSPMRGEEATRVRAAIDRWTSQNRLQVEKETAGMAANIRNDLSYKASDGRSYPYLGGVDGYLWMRYAGTRLRTGSPCDAVIDGLCRDLHNSAPSGSVTPYAQRLHPTALALLHRFVTIFHPAQPLPATAFLIGILLGELTIIPAYFLGRKLGGMPGGLFAAAFIAVSPAILGRTMAGDDDSWNVLVPLCSILAVSNAFNAPQKWRFYAWILAASAGVGLQSWSWSGWPLLYTVILAGLACAILSGALHWLSIEKNARIWNSGFVQKSSAASILLYIVCGVFVALAVSPAEYLHVPAAVLAAAREAWSGHPGSSVSAGFAWPTALDGVAELKRLHLAEIARNMSGNVITILAFLGLLVLALPGKPWRRTDVILFAGSAVFYGATALSRDLGQTATVAVIALPVIVCLSRTAMMRGADLNRTAIGSLIAVWMLVCLYAAFSGARFLILLAPPVGFAVAGAIGSATRAIEKALENEPVWYRRAARAASIAVFVIITLTPVRLGYAVAREYAPEMNHAWWDILTALRARAAPDAIVHTWWDYGDWVTYVSDRRVDNDGTSLLTHVPVWIGKALATPLERESAGILQMLGCGSDLPPSGGIPPGAWSKLLAMQMNPPAAYALLTDVTHLDEPAAEAYLGQRGITPEQSRNLLRSTHCMPPESWLILSSGLVGKRHEWMRLGLWDPRAGGGDLARDPDTGATAVPFIDKWFACRPDTAAHVMTCEIDSEIPGRPERFGQLTVTQSGSIQLAGIRSRLDVNGPPEYMLRAGAAAMEQTHFANSAYPGLAILLDEKNSRMLVGAADFLQSTYVQLMYLDGRYARHYAKADERSAAGERVVLWKIGPPSVSPAMRVN